MSETSSSAARPDLGVIIALAWLGVALGVTALFGPRLGMRGWAWLLLHDAVCALACAHELRRGWRRRRLRSGRAAEDRRTG